MTVRNQNDSYLKKHLRGLISRHGGKWIIISGGRPVAICSKRSLKRYFDLARKKHPGKTPLVSPIPTKEQVHCILSNFPTRK